MNLIKSQVYECWDFPYQTCARAQTFIIVSHKYNAMKNGRVAVIILIAISVTIVECKVFTRCQLTRELLKNGFSRTFISNWVCLIEQESDRNTSAYLAKTPRRKYYGLFQVTLLDEDIRDDGVCALKVFEQEGFKYWSRWEARCKGQNLPDIEKCPDWQYPTNRASPPRDKRTLRGRRSALRRKRFSLYLEQTKA
ncbi:PREDICTED: lysozyme-like [Papilio polytes]|uniref:lysozyme-like n=1 Tax=Papilio polytes TaxID=76194 RepID=UPI000675E9F2|nr:PREDICTED: lysozyme-like [Papilio polytes]